MEPVISITISPLSLASPLTTVLPVEVSSHASVQSCPFNSPPVLFALHQFCTAECLLLITPPLILSSALELFLTAMKLYCVNVPPFMLSTAILAAADSVASVPSLHISDEPTIEPEGFVFLYPELLVTIAFSIVIVPLFIMT